MGFTSYSTSSRAVRAEKLEYSTASVDAIFEQNKVGKAHDSMKSQGIILRECRDSEAHPNTVPVVLALDVTGSMRTIPHELIKEGLPTLMSRLIQNGSPDASLLFLAVGDHVYDQYPLQVGQFESGDAELDMWLTRTYLEGGGGGNRGESYLLAWYFAANHTAIDAFDQRNKKGFLFTVGDEPCLDYIPASALGSIMGNEAQAGISAEQLLKAAQDKYEVFHIHVMQGSAGEASLPYWQNLLGQRCLVVRNYRDIPKVISDAVAEFSSVMTSPTASVVDVTSTKITL